METVGIIHYDEIALKGGNRKSYENMLTHAIAQKCAGACVPCVVENKWGRIVIRMQKEQSWKETYTQTLRHILSTTPGVAVFGIGSMVPSTEKDILAGVEHVAQYIKKREVPFDTFRITTMRTHKEFPVSSNYINEVAGGVVLSVFDTKKKVQLKKADLVMRVEILSDASYIYQYEPGLSGLPIGSSGKAISLLSGGFDSPVATHMCAVRGVRPILLHFHAYPHTSRAAMEKVEAIGKVLRDVCGPITLIMVPLLAAQKNISFCAPERLRVVLYRRIMMRVAEALAYKYAAKAIITGESVGQVASQTLENINVVARATELPILRPLAGMNKRDIIDRSRAIGTHDISILPHDDTCTVFMPKHPETRAKIEDVLQAERHYDSEKLVLNMLQGAEVHML